MQWENGAAPWAEHSVDFGFDGRSGRTVQRTFGAKRLPDNFGSITPDRPMELQDEFLYRAMGRSFSIFVIDHEGKPLSAVLRERLTTHKAAVTEERVDDVETIRLTFTYENADRKRPRFESSYWFDPARGYALIKQRDSAHRQAGDVQRTIHVLKLTEAAPGIWYPVKAVYDSPMPGKPDVQERLTYEAESAVANDKTFDEAVFTVPFPPGYLIYNTSSKTYHNVDETGKLRSKAVAMPTTNPSMP